MDVACGTYTIGVNAFGSSPPDHEYRVFVTLGSDPARTEEPLAEVLDEVDWLSAGGGQKYLDTVKELLHSSRQERLRENGFWAQADQAAVQR